MKNEINTKKNNRKLIKKQKKNKIQNFHGKGFKEYQGYVFQGRVLKEDKILKKIREKDTRRACFLQLFWKAKYSEFTLKSWNNMG